MKTNYTTKMSGLALTLAVGFTLTCNAPAAKACSGPQKTNFVAALNRAAAIKMLQAPKPKAQVRPATDADTAPVAHDVPNPTIVGLWQIEYLAEGQVVDQGYESWHDDGTETLVDTAPPATDNVCIGTWSQTGSLTFRLKHPSWTFDMNGNLTGTAIIRNVLNLDRSGDKYTGTFTVDIFDVDGQHVDHFEGQVVGTRIKPD